MSSLESYSNLFGPKTSKGQLYGGFWLLIGGVLLGLAAFSLFLYASLGAEGRAEYAWREGAFALMAVAGATILLGITLALPTKAAMRIASFVGFGFCLLGTVLFVVHYPDNFNIKNPQPGQDDHTGLDAGVYVAGAVALLSSVFTSIIGYYLDRLRPAGAAGEEDDEFAGYEVPDWVVERDIEYAMKRHGVSWGDGPGARDTGLAVNIPDSLGSNIKIGGLGKARTVQLDATQVDESVGKLSGVRPQTKGAVPGEWADEATRALVAFRKQKAANPTAYKPRLGFWARAWDWVTGRSRRQQRSASLAGGVGSAPSAGPSRATPSLPSAAAMPRRGTTVVIHDAPEEKPASRPPVAKAAAKGKK